MTVQGQARRRELVRGLQDVEVLRRKAFEEYDLCLDVAFEVKRILRLETNASVTRQALFERFIAE